MRGLGDLLDVVSRRLHLVVAGRVTHQLLDFGEDRIFLAAAAAAAAAAKRVGKDRAQAIGSLHRANEAAQQIAAELGFGRGHDATFTN